MHPENSIKRAYCEYLNTPRGAEVYREFKRILYTEDDSLVSILNTQVFQDVLCVRQEDVLVCDIGGGDGDRITRILRFLHDKFHSSFELDFIEQSALHVSAFNTRRLVPFCTVKRIHAMFEDVLLHDRRYDLVCLIHSIFAFQNGRAIQKLLSIVNDSGTIIVVSNAVDSFLGGLKRLVDEDYQDQRYEIDSLVRDLQGKKIPFASIEFATPWSIEDDSEDLAILLEWISLGAYPNFSAERKAVIAEYIDQHSSMEGNRRFFSENELILLIRRDSVESKQPVV